MVSFTRPVLVRIDQHRRMGCREHKRGRRSERELAQYDQHSGVSQSVQVRRHPVEPCRPATRMAALVRRAIHRTVRLPLAVLCQLHHRLRQTHLQRQCLRRRMLVGLFETPEYPLELHRRDRGRYRLYPLHREAAAEVHRGVRRRVYLSSPPVPARPDQMQPVIFLLVLIHRSHDNDFRKFQRIQDPGIVCR